MWTLLARSVSFLIKVIERSYMYLQASRFGKFEKECLFHPFSTKVIGHKNIHMRYGSTIGPGSIIYAIDSKLFIGRKTGIGPGTIIMCGNHSTHHPGKFYKDYLPEDKMTRDDADIIIEDDVWIGAGCILLKGTHIERGAVIGAGSLVNSRIKAYDVAVGSPAKRVRARFKEEDQNLHDQFLELG